MTVPAIVQERLGDEEIGGRIPLGGEDELLVTRTRTIVYRGEGLLSGEAVEEYPHGAERIELGEGRRKSKIRLDYGIDGREELTVPTDRLMDALRAVFAGVLFSAGVIRPGETVERLYRRGELTFAITSARIIKHVGADVWNEEEFEEFPFDDVTGLDVEPGEVSSVLILEVDGRPERIKTPSEDVREIRVNVERALLAHHDMGSYEEFAEAIAEERGEDEPEAEAAEAAVEESSAASVFDSELDLIGATTESLSSSGSSASPASSTGGGRGEATGVGDGGSAAVAAEAGTADPDFEEAGFESAAAGGASDTDTDPASAIAELRSAVERQTELIEEQQRTLEQLIEELKRGR